MERDVVELDGRHGLADGGIGRAERPVGGEVPAEGRHRGGGGQVGHHVQPNRSRAVERRVQQGRGVRGGRVGEAQPIVRRVEVQRERAGQHAARIARSHGQETQRAGRRAGPGLAVGARAERDVRQRRIDGDRHFVGAAGFEERPVGGADAEAQRRIEADRKRHRRVDRHAQARQRQVEVDRHGRRRHVAMELDVEDHFRGRRRHAHVVDSEVAVAGGVDQPALPARAERVEDRLADLGSRRTGGQDVEYAFACVVEQSDAVGQLAADQRQRVGEGDLVGGGVEPGHQVVPARAERAEVGGEVEPNVVVDRLHVRAGRGVAESVARDDQVGLGPGRGETERQIRIQPAGQRDVGIGQRGAAECAPSVAGRVERHGKLRRRRRGPAPSTS